MKWNRETKGGMTRRYVSEDGRFEILPSIQRGRWGRGVPRISYWMLFEGDMRLATGTLNACKKAAEREVV